MVMPLTAGTGGGSETITTGTTSNDYGSDADRDVAMAGVEGSVFTIENTHGSRGITVDAVEEFAKYTAGEKNSITGFPANITAGNKGKIELNKTRSRFSIFIKSQVADNPATWEIADTINRL